MRLKSVTAIFLALCCFIVTPFAYAEAEPAPTPSSETVTETLLNDAGEASMMQAKNGGGGIPALTMTVNSDGTEDYSVTLQILALMTALGFLPAIVILMTSFTRIVVVMSILRQAMGLQQTPSNQVIIGISMFLTFFIMSPVIDRMNVSAVQPYMNEEISSKEAFERVQVPLREFMLKQTRVKDLETFVNMSGSDATDPETVPMSVLIPAFITSELKTAFQIGFMLFLPFLIIDLVVASVLMAMGMMMLSPMIVSLPFKLMLFVLVDGWNLILSTLAGSFG
ncbi:flagellar biosynthetic protein FliP [Enterovibrio norvegicus]|uniref:flagellar type III secretion system pore protein FliP n=1 Tax=Enterovibrio norvegicus TaxID=188144 RepID=UPI0002F745F4|nr:flagellar type III secretion system pore protein FliP [Enterovibrio norvegicus]OEF59561.1 flagellar biosynthetic protein FliP [Enterovibrio norvegicus]